jgi:hypothetical protein
MHLSEVLYIRLCADTVQNLDSYLSRRYGSYFRLHANSCHVATIRCHVRRKVSYRRPLWLRVRSLTTLSVFAGGMVVVKVGKAKRENHVHRRLLRSRSPYFNSILTSCDDKTTTISFPDVDADTFYAFLSWLYSDCFTLPKDDEWMNLCKLWLLAERFKVLR